MFNFFKKTKEKNNRLFHSPVLGQQLLIEDVGDDTFATKLLGDGIAVRPIDGDIFAPVDGEVVMVFPTKHAFGMITDDGIEVMVHIGLDTVMLNGKYFSLKLKAGDRIYTGEKIGHFDVESVKNEGYDPVTFLIVTNDNGHKYSIVKHSSTLNKDDVVLEVS